jgi:hypothetical protein
VGVQRRSVLVPGLNRVTDPALEIVFLQNFEYNSTKL